MEVQDAIGQAYKNGYEDGKKDAVKWISVKDRLPQQGQEVIVYSGGVLKPTVFAYQYNSGIAVCW